jgi:hypothetical protein
MAREDKVESLTGLMLVIEVPAVIIPPLDLTTCCAVQPNRNTLASPAFLGKKLSPRSHRPRKAFGVLNSSELRNCVLEAWCSVTSKTWG